MEVNIKLKLKPFTTPNFVLVDEPSKPRGEGFSEGRKFALSELDAETLERMCDDFTREVFKKSGKQRPPQPDRGR